jgi:hypothetical protein
VSQPRIFHVLRTSVFLCIRYLRSRRKNSNNIVRKLKNKYTFKRYVVAKIRKLEVSKSRDRCILLHYVGDAPSCSFHSSGMDHKWWRFFYPLCKKIFFGFTLNESMNSSHLSALCSNPWVHQSTCLCLHTASPAYHKTSTNSEISFYIRKSLYLRTANSKSTACRFSTSRSRTRPLSSLCAIRQLYGRCWRALHTVIFFIIKNWKFLVVSW